MWNGFGRSSSNSSRTPHSMEGRAHVRRHLADGPHPTSARPIYRKRAPPSRNPTIWEKGADCCRQLRRTVAQLARSVARGAFFPLLSHINGKRAQRDRLAPDCCVRQPALLWTATEQAGPPTRFQRALLRRSASPDARSVARETLAALWNGTSGENLCRHTGQSALPNVRAEAAYSGR